MGYNFTIGERELVIDGNSCWFTAKVVRDDAAPAFAGELLSAYTNVRYPSYITWADFIENTPLNDHFVTSNGIHDRENYPGVTTITKRLVEAITAAHASYSKQPITNDEEQWHHNRMEWLHYWITWAYANCRIPVIAAS